MIYIYIYIYIYTYSRELHGNQLCQRGRVPLCVDVCACVCVCCTRMHNMYIYIYIYIRCVGTHHLTFAYQKKKIRSIDAWYVCTTRSMHTCIHTRWFDTTSHACFLPCTYIYTCMHTHIHAYTHDGLTPLRILASHHIHTHINEYIHTGWFHTAHACCS